MTRVGRWLILAAAVCLTATAAFGQEKPAEKPKTLLEEIVLFSYIENRTISSSNVFRSEEHTSQLQSHSDRVCSLLLEKKNTKKKPTRAEMVKHDARIHV